MRLPTKEQIQRAVSGMEKAHYMMGYLRTPRDLEVMLWAAIFCGELIPLDRPEPNHDEQ